MADKSPWIITATAATLQAEVLDRSAEVPVVLDFWAAWCQPCRMLGPVLERLADQHQGKFLLVKVDIEDPQLAPVANAFGVESIPAVFALKNGKIVDQFVGVLPEDELQAWIERLLPSPAEALTDQAEALEVVDPATAEVKYREAIGLLPNDTGPRISLARLLLSQNRLDEARQEIEDLAAAGVLGAEGERVHAELTLQLQARQAGSLEQVQAAAETSPSDLGLQLKLAQVLAAAGEHQKAMDLCLTLVQKDRQGIGEKARELMVHVFHVLGPESDLASTYRRKLTMLLY